MTMTSAAVTLAGLSDEAKKAILAADGRHQGQGVHGDAQTLAELYRAGVVGKAGGLTRFGSILAEKLRDAALEAAFG